MNERIEELMSIVSEGQNSIQRQEIEDYINQLQSNWNSLREWLKEEIEKVNGTENVCFQKVYYEEVLDKMNELESDEKN